MINWLDGMGDTNLDKYFGDILGSLRHSGYKDEDIEESFNHSITQDKKKGKVGFLIASLILGFVVSLSVALFIGIFGPSALEAQIFALIIFLSFTCLTNLSLKRFYDNKNIFSIRFILSIITSGIYVGAHFLIKNFLSLISERFNQVLETNNLIETLGALHFDYMISPIIIIAVILIVYNLLPLIKIGKVDFKKKVKIGK